jgi:hypothetical protein
MTLPNFLIVGAMRSGTTWLSRCLGEHQDVFMAKRKELHFFDSNHERGLEWYQQQFRSANGALAVGEATARYMCDPLSLERIARLLPDVRLIAILRDPSDRAYSHYWLNRARGWESVPFEEALEREPERILRSREDYFRYAYVERGRYGAQVKRLRERFGPSRVHVMLLDDFQGDPAGEFSRVCGFLGVSQGVAVPMLRQRVNAYRRFRSIRVRNAATRLPGRGPGKLVRSAIGRLNAKPVQYPPMPDKARDRIRDLLESDILALQSLLGRDLSTWAR